MRLCEVLPTTRNILVSKCCDFANFDFEAECGGDGEAEAGAHRNHAATITQRVVPHDEDHPKDPDVHVDVEASDGGGGGSGGGGGEAEHRGDSRDKGAPEAAEPEHSADTNRRDEQLQGDVKRDDDEGDDSMKLDPGGVVLTDQQELAYASLWGDTPQPWEAPGLTRDEEEDLLDTELEVRTVDFIHVHLTTFCCFFDLCSDFSLESFFTEGRWAHTDGVLPVELLPQYGSLVDMKKSSISEVYHHPAARR